MNLHRYIKTNWREERGRGRGGSKGEPGRGRTRGGRDERRRRGGRQTGKKMKRGLGGRGDTRGKERKYIILINKKIGICEISARIREGLGEGLCEPAEALGIRHVQHNL